MPSSQSGTTSGGSLHTSKHVLDLGMREISSVHEYARDFLGVGNILQGISTEHHQVRELSLLDGAKLRFHSKESRRIQCGGLQRFQRREPGCHESLLFLVQTEAVEYVNATGGVRCCN